MMMFLHFRLLSSFYGLLTFSLRTGRGLMGTVRICKTKSSSSSSGNNSSSSSSSSKNGDKSAEKGGKNADINGNNTSNSKYFVLKAVKKDYISKHNDLRHVLNEKEALRAVTSPFCVKVLNFKTITNCHISFSLRTALRHLPGPPLHLLRSGIRPRWRTLPSPRQKEGTPIAAQPA